MTPCYYCEYPKETCKWCIHGEFDPDETMNRILFLIEVDKDGDGFICKEALNEVRQLCGA